MPAFSRDLETTLKRALSIAEEKGHGHVSPAHLVLALVDDVEGRQLLRGCGADVAALTGALHRLADATSDRPPTAWGPAGPDDAYDATVQRAVEHARKNGREHIGRGQIVVAILGDPEHEVARLLRDAGVTRYDATRYLSHGIRKGRTAPIGMTASMDPREKMRVMLLNDDYTPMEFVVDVLRSVFGKGEDEAVRVMLEIHRRGFAECGAYPRETAAATVAAVAKLARDHQHPLGCVMEPLRGPSDALLFTQPRTVIASGPGDRQRA